MHLTQFGPLYFWHEDTQEYYPLLFTENSKPNKTKVDDAVNNDGMVNQRKLNIPQDSTKQMIE